MSYTGETEYNNRITMAYALLSSISQEAYKHPFLLSNQVLSKNPFTTNFLARYLDRENPAMPSRLMVLAKLAKYYLLSLRDLISYVKEFAEYYLSGLRFRHPENKSELVLIDMPFLVSKLNNPGVLPDSFFPGLASFLEKNKMNYAYLPVFDGMKKIFEFHGILSGLRKNKAQILCEYQLLGSGDLFKILYFILVYPIEVIRLARSLDTNDFGRRLVRYELLDTLSQPAFRAFSRYCQGRSIAGLPYEKIKVISWYENQAIHKNLYKGLRIRSEKVAIYGAQLFIYSRNQLNIIPDENEEVF
ncbi:MAG: hypothetical protein NTU54_00020 [Candidatus Omnitrophica bacterium]|nr:hypothetical protein [Candidatus Omnitrophota bacterium]